MVSPDLSVFGQIKTKADFDRVEEEFQLRKMQALKQAQGNDPAALQLANEYLAAKQSGDMERANAIQEFAKSQQKGVMQLADGSYVPLMGMPQALGQLEFGKNLGGETATQQVKSAYEPQRAEDIANRQLNVQTGGAAELERQKEIGSASGVLYGKQQEELAGGQKILPVIDELKAFNQSSPSIPYAGKTQWARRLYPGTSTAESAVDLMRQARIDLAAPLAKQLGVNPTDKDFQASLDRIFDIEATKESRATQITALEKRIKNRQKQLDPLAASRAAIEGANAQGIQNPYQTIPTAPLNIDPDLFNHMTPEERALFGQ